MLKNIWLFQTVCQSLLSGNALEKFNGYFSLGGNLVSLFRSISFLEDMLYLTPASEKEKDVHVEQTRIFQ